MGLDIELNPFTNKLDLVQDITETIALNDLSDVSIVSAASNDFLYFNGTAWTDYDLFGGNNTWTGDNRVSTGLFHFSDNTFRFDSVGGGTLTLNADAAQLNDNIILFPRLDVDDTFGLLGTSQTWTNVNTIYKIILNGGGTSTAPLVINSSAAPTTPGDGNIWNDSTRKCLQTFESGIKQSLVGAIFTQTADTTVANTTTETSIIGTGIGTISLPGSFFTAGKTINFHVHGYHSSTGNPTLTVRVKLGSTTVCSGIVTSGNGSTQGFNIDGLITCRTTGTTGTVSAGGEFSELHSSGQTTGLIQTGTTTINTTSSQVLSITVQWGTASAGNTITSQISAWTVLN